MAVVKDLTNLKICIRDAIARDGAACDLNHIDVSQISSMEGLFSNSNFVGDISKWDVSNILNMRDMFRNSLFDGDISSWNVKNVCFADYMFCGSHFNGHLENWEFERNGLTMNYMFAHSKFNGSVQNWNMGLVMSAIGMFEDSLFQGNLSSWTLGTPKIKNMLPVEFAGNMPSLLHFEHCKQEYASMFPKAKDLYAYLKKAPVQSVHSDILLMSDKKPEWISKIDFTFFKENQCIGESIGMSKLDLRQHMLATFTKYKAGVSNDVPLLSLDGLLAF